MKKNIDNNPQALVLSPTRELTMKTQRFAQSLTHFINVRVHSFFGGKSFREGMRVFDRGANRLLVVHLDRFTI